MQSDIFEKQITVKKEHLDALNHVNNVVYLQWVQDIAGEHWFEKSSKEFNEAYFWVVLDHFIEYKRQAFLDDVLTVRTYIEKNEGVRSVRMVEFLKADKLVVKAKTNWCLIDRKRQRPCRVPQEINDLFFSKT